ncbi:MAG: hypothetical protein K8R91_06085 [Phycisphaerae bacterium]|nr:hypothetical protein [Phycisphaerae bacterium]
MGLKNYVKKVFGDIKQKAKDFKTRHKIYSEWDEIKSILDNGYYETNKESCKKLEEMLNLIDEVKKYNKSTNNKEIDIDVCMNSYYKSELTVDNEWLTRASYGLPN